MLHTRRKKIKQINTAIRIACDQHDISMMHRYHTSQPMYRHAYVVATSFTAITFTPESVHHLPGRLRRHRSFLVIPAVPAIFVFISPDFGTPHWSAFRFRFAGTASIAATKISCICPRKSKPTLYQILIPCTQYRY